MERENAELRHRLEETEMRYQELLDVKHEERRAGTRSSCVLCGGSLLPVAVFAGRDTLNPVPIHISTMRFGSPRGGFTHTAPYRSMACASCGFIHSFIDFE